MNARPMVPADFQVGDRVVITASLLRGRTGTISRPARSLGRDAWMIELDGGSRWTLGRRTRILERALRHVPPSA